VAGELPIYFYNFKSIGIFYIYDASKHIQTEEISENELLIRKTFLFFLSTNELRIVVKLG